ncbi:U3-containing 90S pre-ribosomal complex subunit-domain containing protein [Lipomyces japonicus]|uniref:U3-containing 90S pre-ribosomal complex subunit-domain containing protein n=1 Tax=Lipomyces japonicus TaxID=56871 RepID=UPI0034CF861C
MSKRKVVNRSLSNIRGGGDDLDDDLDYSFDGVASGDEADAVTVADLANIDDDSDDDYGNLENAKGNRNISPHHDDAKNTGKDDKRKRRKEKMAAKKRQRMETEMVVKKSIAITESSIISDYFSKKARIWHPKLSSIELDDLYALPQSRILEMSTFNQDRELNKFTDFLTHASDIKNLESASEDKGAPKIIIISISALRVCDVKRAIPKNIKSLKIIAKNNLASDCQTLQRLNPTVVLSTPTRIMSVLDKGALSLQNLQLVIIDSSHLDSKMRTVLDDVPETIAITRRLVDGNSDAKVALY